MLLGSAPGTSKAAPGHKIYPYLLRGLKIVEPVAREEHLHAGFSEQS